jgi:GalNAc-alpha-(1->4)-GalNAc-alpha-(1->3)-diNAcBac-PP-undecaprenol alpha-1,4-N-acetyl-D-galactosaminyltransferase
MKIAFVIGSLTLGGAEKVATLLCNQFSLDNNVAIFLTSIKQKSTYKLSGAVSINYVSETVEINPFRKIRILHRLLMNFNPDVVIAFNDPCTFYASVAVKGLKAKLICSERNSPREYPVNKVFRFLRRIAYNSAFAVVFQTREALSFFSKRIQNKGVVISNPAVVPSIVRAAPSQIKKNVVVIGRLEPQKNIAMAVKAFSLFYKSHADYTLDLYGVGSDEGAIKELCHKLKIDKTVMFHGFCSDIENVLSTAGIYILTSNFEGMPNALIEAITMSVPSVATDCPSGGVRAISFGVSSVVLAPIGNESIFSQKMAEICDNYVNYQNLAKKAAVQYLEEHSVSKIASDWFDVMRRT